MLKLGVLLIIPGLLAGFVNEDIKRKEKFDFGKYVLSGLLFSYILFLTDVTLLYIFFSERYENFIAFLERPVETVRDLYLFVLFFFVQLLLAYAYGFMCRIKRCGSVERAFLRITAMQQNVAMSVLGISLLAVILIFTAKDNAERQLVINEVCSRNDGVLADENGNYSDYIEIYNPSRWNLLLKDFQISDNADFSEKIVLREVVLPIKGHYIIWIDEESAEFGLSESGETIYLANAGGVTLDTVTVPGLEPDMVYARVTDGEDAWMTEVATPLAANDARKKYLDEPVFSAKSGFYEEEFQLSITAGEGERIYYTLDGSTPDENDTLYTETITVKNVTNNPNVYRNIPNVVEDWEGFEPLSEPVDKVFIVRAVSIDDYGNTSDVVTQTYFVDMEEYRDLYVLSLVSDPDDLFGDDGIYVTGKEYDEWYSGSREAASVEVNYRKRGKEAEIETAVALFKDDLLMEQQAGLRIQGNSMRENVLKRFSVFARKEYSGSRYFDYDLFGEQMHAFFMRPDFADAFIHSLVTDRNVGTLKAVPAVVFLDGEFWYTTYLREKYNEDYIAAVYDVAPTQVRMEESMPQEIYDFLDTHDLSKDEDYQQFCELVDMESYIDYLAINIYTCNMDNSESKNYRLWKTTVDTAQEYGDGRWRWLLYDMDSVEWNSIGNYGAMRHDIDSFAQVKEYTHIAYNQEKMYKAVRVNEEFCKQFVLTFMDLANTNFSRDVVASQITDWGKDMTWNDGFYEYRFDGIVPALAKEFGLKGTLEEIELSVSDVDAGYVTINTATPDLQDGSWSGRYYTDYPVTITAVPQDGYEFVGWKSGEELIKEIQISVQIPKGGCSLEAVFEKKERK